MKETDFMSELDAAARIKPSCTSNLMLIAIVALIAFLIGWAYFSKIDEIVRGGGQVVPSQEVQVVQSLEGGILQELLVTEGERVKKGQILMKIRDVSFASEERGTEAQYLSLQAQMARLEAEANGTDFVIDDEIKKKIPGIVKNEQDLHASRQAELANAISILKDKINQAKSDIAATNADIKQLKGSRSLLYQELKITSEMVKQKAAPKIEEIRLQRQITEASGKLQSQQEALKGLESGLKSAQKELEDQHDKFRSQALSDLGQVKTKMAQLKESLKSIGDRVYRTELRAPVDGVVNKIALKTIGGVVEPAQRLMEIVPTDDQLKIIARVKPRDIAFLKAGQPVKVKITAYDPQIYGSLDGQLVRIGANSITDRDGNISFEIEVHTAKNYLGTADSPLPITPGMVAETEVIVGKRTIMEYLLKPVVRAKDRALTEH